MTRLKLYGPAFVCFALALWVGLLGTSRVLEVVGLVLLAVAVMMQVREARSQHRRRRRGG